MKSIVLSICIPTYNRVRYLKELLPSILDQADAEGVEVVVSDNASTDDTAEYLRTIKHPRLRWWTNDVNIGGDRNFLKCVAEARGAYVWLFGDDDIMPAGAVGRVFDFLGRHNPALLISVDCDVDARLYDDYCAMLKDVGDDFLLAHTLISANVFRRELFDMDLAVKKLWVQYAHMFGIMANMVGHKVGIMSRFVETRPVRADFAKFPSCLCVKQAIYVWFIARRFGISRLRRRALLNACNLPVEYAARIWNWFKRRRRVDT